MSEKAKLTMGLAGVFALCLSNLAYMSDLIILPCYAAIFGHFANDSVLVTNFIASGTQLTVIIGGLLAPVLMRHFSKKMILVVTFGLFIIQGCCTGLVDSSAYVAVMRGITGVFMGIQFPTALALLVEVFRDDDAKRAKYTGWFDGTMAGMGAVLMILGGILLSAFGWQSIFWGYLIGVPIWFMIVFCCPKTPPEKDVDYEAQRKEKGVEHDVEFNRWKFVCIIIACLFAQMLYGCIVYEFSIYLAENFVLPAWANGVLGAAKGIIGFICGMFVFAPLFKRAKRFTITVCFASQAIAYYGLYFVPAAGIAGSALGLVLFLVFYAFIGIAFGLSIPYYHSYSAAVFPAEKIPLVTSAISIGLSLGAFLAPYLVTFIQTTMHIETYTGVLPIIGIICIVAAALTIIAGINDKDRKRAFAKIAQGQLEDAGTRAQEKPDDAS